MTMPTPNGIFSDLTVYRKTGGSRIEGHWVAGDETTFTIRGSLQPLSGEDLKRLPEGARTADRRVLITPTMGLKTQRQSEMQEADEILHAGYRWAVESSEDWPFLDIQHGEYILVRQEPPDPNP